MKKIKILFYLNSGIHLSFDRSYTAFDRLNPFLSEDRKIFAILVPQLLSRCCGKFDKDNWFSFVPCDSWIFDLFWTGSRIRERNIILHQHIARFPWIQILNENSNLFRIDEFNQLHTKSIGIRLLSLFKCPFKSK